VALCRRLSVVTKGRVGPVGRAGRVGRTATCAEEMGKPDQVHPCAGIAWPFDLLDPPGLPAYPAYASEASAVTQRRRESQLSTQSTRIED